MMKDAALFSVIILFCALTVLNVLAWQRSERVQEQLETCVREYRLLLGEHPCPAR